MFVYLCLCVCVFALIFRYSCPMLSGLATLAHVSGSWHSPWLATIQRLPVLHCMVLSPVHSSIIHPFTQFIHSSYLASHILLHGAMWTRPRKINSGGQSEGEVTGGHRVSVLGSPGRVALVMAASRPVCLWQRQTLPEVLQLCL